MTTPEPQHAQAVATDPTPAQPVAQEPTAAPTAQPEYEHTAETSRHDGESLFGGIDLSGLRTRWDDVQAAFVDDPRECVQKADRLVSDVVDQLTTGFADARSQLEEQWSRGQEASTEDLRQALKRYREFFQRLLSVS
jgi:hypothetical protein